MNEKHNELNTQIEKSSSSLKNNNSEEIKLELLLATILNELEKSFEAEEKHLVNQWTKYCNHINQNIQFHEKNKLISGLFTGINQNGQAIININNHTEFISSGIIEI